MENGNAPERWLPIPGREGAYEVSDLGRVRSVDRVVPYADGRVIRRPGRILKPWAFSDGRLCVNLGRGDRWLVHRLVLSAFVGPCPPGMEGCHNNGDHTDNRRVNLRWDTHSANTLDKQEHGTDHNVNKPSCPRGHLLDHPNLKPCVTRRGYRECLACSRAMNMKHYYLRKHGSDAFYDFERSADRYYAEIMRAS